MDEESEIPAREEAHQYISPLSPTPTPPCFPSFEGLFFFSSFFVSGLALMRGLHEWYGSPLKLFDLAKSAGRVLYVQAPMVRYVLPKM